MVVPSTKGSRRCYVASAVVLAAVLAVLSVRDVDWRQMAMTFRQARFTYLLLGCLAACGAYVLRALRWQVLLAADTGLPVLPVFWANMAGYLGNNLLPARAGEALRSVLLARRYHLSTSFVLATALTDRVLDAVALVLIGAGSLVWLGGPSGWLLDAVRLMAVVTSAAFVGLLIVPLCEKRIGAWLAALPLAGRWRGFSGERILANVILGMRSFQRPGPGVAFAGLTLAVWVLDAWGTVLVARSLDLSLSLVQSLVFLAAIALSSALPSVPGYIGVYQFVAVTVLPVFGLSKSQALLFIIILQGCGYLLVAVLGAWGLWRLGGRLRASGAISRAG